MLSLALAAAALPSVLVVAVLLFGWPMTPRQHEDPEPPPPGRPRREDFRLAA